MKNVRYISLPKIEKEKQKNFNQDVSRIKNGQFWSQKKIFKRDRRVVFISFSMMGKDWLVICINPRKWTKFGLLPWNLNWRGKTNPQDNTVVKLWVQNKWYFYWNLEVYRKRRDHLAHLRYLMKFWDLQRCQMSGETALRFLLRTSEVIKLKSLCKLVELP